MSTPIPGPAGWPFLGNINDIDPEVPVKSLMDIADKYGSIYSLSILGKRRVIVSSVELLNEICDEKRFGKVVTAALGEVRNLTGDGLFTAHNGEHNWEVAHRVLVPAFGPLNIRSMFDDMKDIASQLVMKWARHGQDYKVHVTDDFTRLTLDTLALCSMDYRFNSFYAEQMHPFVDAMVNVLSESGSRIRRPGFLAALYRKEEYQYWKDVEYLRELSSELVQNRKKHPGSRKDLLHAMLHGKDPRNGDSLSDESIIDNMITFLIAGHETTSGLLSFLFYYLLKNPSAYKKAQEEVDKVIGDASIKVAHLSKLPYINAVLRETLRLQPTAPAFSIQPNNEIDVIGGEYTVHKSQPIIALLPKIHRDPAVYGEDANEFKPERMLDENFNKLPPNAWKPFGNGSRACIGRPFAWQEAQLVVAMLLQYFDFTLDDAKYDLQIKSTLTIKPNHFYMHAQLRHGRTPTQLEQILSSNGTPVQKHQSSRPDDEATRATTDESKGRPLTILYGSNTGTCQAFAQGLAADAPSHGFKVTKIDTLDSAKDNLPTDQPIAIVTCSYEGEPADNAAHFYHWLESLQGDSTKVQYAVFGAGHSDWKNTFHKIPTAIDDILLARGGERICSRGSANAANGDMFSEFEKWEDDVFWPAMASKYGGDSSTTDSTATQSLTVEVSSVRSSHLRADVYEARVVDAKLLSHPGASEKRHIEVELPASATYSSGDYLHVLPINPHESVQRVMRRFNLAWDSVLTIKAAVGTILPTDVPISANDLFGAYVELGQPATKRNVTLLLDVCTDNETKKELTRLSGDAFSTEISEKRVSLLDLLNRFPSVQLPLSAFISSLPPMRTRSYSISSSSLVNPHRVTLTFAVLHQSHMSGMGEYVGVASNYLSQLAAGDKLHVAVRPSSQAFHLPVDYENTPVIMLCAGTGLAPFRGFVQERAAQVEAGRKLAPALLVVGCRSPDEDELYREDFDKWEAAGAVKILRAYSRKPEASGGSKYAQDALWEHRKEALELWDAGSRVYVCGSRGLERSVQQVCQKIYMERAKELGKDKTDQEAEQWFEGIRNVRFATDVFT
ncbi:cytochrome P450 [Aureobasidium subglaciale]|nr:cytochrome P450 [Aureobasidium subglaciale]